jgi:hypothetical protein
LDDFSAHLAAEHTAAQKTGIVQYIKQRPIKTVNITEEVEEWQKAHKMPLSGNPNVRGRFQCKPPDKTKVKACSSTKKACSTITKGEGLGKKIQTTSANDTVENNFVPTMLYDNSVLPGSPMLNLGNTCYFNSLMQAIVNTQLVSIVLGQIDEIDNTANGI